MDSRLKLQVQLQISSITKKTILSYFSHCITLCFWCPVVNHLPSFRGSSLKLDWSHGLCGQAHGMCYRGDDPTKLKQGWAHSSIPHVLWRTHILSEKLKNGIPLYHPHEICGFQTNTDNLVGNSANLYCYQMYFESQTVRPL